VKNVSAAAVVSVPLDQIVIGVRRRENLGRIKALAASIEAHGLIHPVLLKANTLIAGHRRVEACRSLGWKVIPARQVERMTDDELRAIELDENTARENLSDYATSKARLAQIRQAEADLKAKAADEGATEVSGATRTRNPKGGRPKGRTPGSKNDVAEQTEVSKRERDRVERHVAIAEAYPFLQRPGFQRHHVLDIGDLFDQLPAADRAPLAALLDQDAIPPAYVIQYLGYAVEMPAARRASIIALSIDPDEFVRRTALTKLAAVPPPVDPGLSALHDAARAISRAATSCRSEAFKPRIGTLAHDVDVVLHEFSAHEKKVRADV
jgi:hypothetical protein